MKTVVLALLAIASVAQASTARAQQWWNEEWSFRKEIVLNAGEGGIAIDGELPSFPTLIRLSADSFNFSEAKFDGGDLRFATADGARRLNHFVESYDVNGSLAFVWVEAPIIAPGTAEPIYLYFGNDAADDDSQPTVVYDENYALVYNFGSISGVPQDATANLNHARSPITVRPGFIGNAAAFDGSSVLLTPPSPSLAVAGQASFTASAWIKIDDAQDGGVVFARDDDAQERDAATALFALAIDGRTPFVTLAGGAAGQGAGGRIDGTVELDLGGWHHLAVRVEGGERSTVTLFVNGQPAGSGDIALPALAGTTSFGGLAEATAGLGGPAGLSNLVGTLDEVRVSRIARSDTWLRASWLDQGPDGLLVQYGRDEELSEQFFSFEYFIVVVQNLSGEGWGVIAILAAMLVIAIVTIVTKSGLVGHVEQTNRRFRDAYAAAEALDVVDGKYGPSGMARVYRTAIGEVARRGGLEGVAGARLDASAITAIRSEVEAALTEHIQDLNRRMVLLTIAISGGPFLGLLGTVLGVMITFAGVAAEGNVNVNAIAPGVAAALLTTVCGLAVAIPSMFAYNWLTTRIREIASQTRVFSNTLTARIADTFGE